MATCSNVWLNEHGAIVEFSDTAIAPCKDFYHVFITPTEFVFRWWKIVPPIRHDCKTDPSETRESYDDFLHDDALHGEIQRLAGQNILQYLIWIAEGHLDYLLRMPDNVLKKIILNLDLVDIVRLGTTCHRFKKLCSDDDVWEGIFRREVETAITPELEVLAKREGWKRLFYTNKLQLQVQLRREMRLNPKLKNEMQLRRERRHDHAFMTEQQQAMDTV